jgi:5-methylcytosine-specific restriction endonuclease McrA
VVWQRFRAWFLAQPEHVMCVDCKSNLSQEVHHVVKLRDCPERKLDPANCIGLCSACHRIRTARGE